MTIFIEIPVMPEMEAFQVIRSWEPDDERDFRLGLTIDGLLLIFPNYELTPEDHEAIKGLY